MPDEVGEYLSSMNDLSLFSLLSLSLFSLLSLSLSSLLDQIAQARIKVNILASIQADRRCSSSYTSCLAADIWREIVSFVGRYFSRQKLLTIHFFTLRASQPHRVLLPIGRYQCKAGANARRARSVSSEQGSAARVRNVTRCHWSNLGEMFGFS